MNYIIIIGSIIIGIMVGGFSGLYFAIMFDKKIYKILIISLSIITVSLFTMIGMKSEINNFNNGYCIRCGTKYEIVTHKNSQTYYECPDCYFGIWR